jgi:hypothetical protein
VRLLLAQADARHLPFAAGCVQCVVTSPPYWGLRDYGTARWDGGDPACGHVEMAVGMSDKNTLGPDRYLPPTNAANVGRVKQYHHVCGKCGATRIDAQLGLEPTPDAYVQGMVAVFREVWRTLRSDGVCFLNLGDSYSSNKYGRIRAYDADQFFRLPVDIRRQVFILWRAALGPSVPRDVCDLLPEDVEEGASGTNEPTREGILRAEQVRVSAENCGSEPKAPHTDDSDAGRVLRVLRGDAPGVPVPGPHQGRRSAGVCQDRRHQRRVEAGDSGGLTKGQIPGALLELQRRAWTLWDVPALELDLASVPREARRLFAVTVKPQDLVGVPWRVALALQADGWWLRSDVIWSKPNPMPESVTSRPTKSHEYVFLLSKSQSYFFDADAVSEPSQGDSWRFTTVQSDAIGRKPSGNQLPQHYDKPGKPTRNIRSVWHIATQPYPGAHFATMPEKLVERCVLAGSKAGDVVLDPFMGSGTVARVALKLGRRAIGCDLNPAYLKLADDRTRVTYGLPLEGEDVA